MRAKKQNETRGWTGVFYCSEFHDSLENDEVSDISIGCRIGDAANGEVLEPGQAGKKKNKTVWLSRIFENADRRTARLAEIFFSSQSRGEMEIKILLEGMSPGDIDNFLMDLKKRVSVFENAGLWASDRTIENRAAEKAALGEIARMAGKFIQEGRK